MSHDDFDVYVFKTLTYILECAKANVIPEINKAKEVSGCNDVMWNMVLRSMYADGYITGISEVTYYDQTCDLYATGAFGITQAGAKYLKENESMKNVRKFLGEAFIKTLPTIIESTRAILNL